MQTDNRLRVLVIDDEADLRQIIKEVFETLGWQVGSAENGKKGLEELLNHKYDLVMSDIRMPIATGVDMLKKLPESIKQTTAIVMMSAYSDQDERSLQNLGARKLIPKPISMNALVREIASFKWHAKNQIINLRD